MNCQKCGGLLVVAYTRTNKDNQITRTRVCNKCGNKVSTIEVYKKEFKATFDLVSGLKELLSNYVKKV